MDNLLRKIETEDVVVYKEQVFSYEILEKCREIHKNLVVEGKLEGAFTDDKWVGNSGIKKCGIDFRMDEEQYAKHIGKEFGISFETMKNMLRCYAIYCFGIYIFYTIFQLKINTIRGFLERYKDNDFKLNSKDICTVVDFLGFIGTPDYQIDTLIKKIRIIKSPSSNQRELSHIINYLVIENEINNIYKDCDNETFKKWFPVYFWINITFILPIRATEMLVTPKNCIIRRNNKVYIVIRRTQLKKKRNTVYYDVYKDYKEFTYEVPDTEVIRNIEKYIKLTAKQDRRFLFEYNDKMINDIVSLSAFNHLLASFVDEYIIGNHKYDFAKFAVGISEFEAVTAGDSRPIAMSNIYFQKFGEEICRQLADHTKIDTSAGYYTNISETIWASSVIQLQRRIENIDKYAEKQYEKGQQLVINHDSSVCMAPKRQYDKDNIDDCVEQDHLEDCMGCKFYRPTTAELDAFLDRQKKKADDSAKRVIEFMNNTMSIKNREVTLEEIFLTVQTDATRYRVGCDIKAKEKYEEWQNHKNIQKTSY